MASYPRTEEIRVESAQGWLTIRLDRPAARNALSETMTRELRAVLEAAREDRAVRGITIRGEGGVFCAGGDVKGFRSIAGEDGTEAKAAAFSREAGEFFHFLNRQPQVVVMCLEGAAMGGGLGLACAGDVVIAAADTKFAFTETAIGVPPAQIAPLVVERIGVAAARRLMLTAARLDARAALDLGLVDVVADGAEELEAAEAQIRAEVLRCAPAAIAVTKDIILATRRLCGEAMIDHAADGFARSLMSEEGREGVAAFLEKRAPGWAPGE